MGDQESGIRRILDSRGFWIREGFRIWFQDSRLVGNSLECADLSALSIDEIRRRSQAFESESGDESPHSKIISRRFDAALNPES
jgi:hypothetical protein